MAESANILTKLQDLLVYLIAQLNKFPRDQNFVLGDRIETKLLDVQEVIRRLGDHAFQILLAGEAVIGGIDADRLEDLGVFSEAVPLEPGFGELAPVFVT